MWYPDLMKVVNSSRSMEEWEKNWMELAMVHQKIAEEALREGSKLTAGEAFFRATQYNHFAQFHDFHNADLKNEAFRRKIENYKRGAPLFRPPSERIEIPFENTKLPGYFRLPEGNKKKAPLVLLVGGLEGGKEENHLFQGLCLERGLATFAFDGPGQNEVWYTMKARLDFEKAASTVLDYFQRRDEIDTDRIAVVGRSLGGYYSPRCAAHDKRLKACVAWSTLYDYDSAWDTMSSLHKDGLAYIAGKKDQDEAREFYKSWTLKGVADKITCPLYILQGRHDDVFPAEHANLLARDAKGPTTLVMEEEGVHCAHNLSHIVRPRIADWVAKTMHA
ncbi:MAG: alpha/beta hydrolase family protein [Rhabdochlamydiaceae bacterium]